MVYCPVDTIIFSALVVLVFMIFWYITALVRKRNDIADVAWGLGFVTIAWANFIRSDMHDDFRTWLTLALVTVWGIRLALHIGSRHFSHDEEDGRYVDMRKKWKYEKIQSFTNVFLSQGFFMLLVATPIMLFFFETPTELAWFNCIGLALWVFAFTFEAVGDYQLKQFIKTKEKGEIMKQGLWKYTRHPNYFGEIMSWWGFFIFTLFTPYWYVGIIGPLTITYLILGVSGIPMLEKRYKGNKDYEQYKEETNAFFPWFPKS